MKRKDILENAVQIVCADRENTYGKPENNFALIAALWNAAFGTNIFTASKVGIALALLKIARIVTGKHKDDNFIDLAGYAACAGEISALEAQQNKYVDDIVADDK